MNPPSFTIESANGLPVQPDRWTAVIPAAGRGSRLGYERPKILLPLLGRTLLEWLLDALSATCSRYILVASPEGRHSIEAAARERLGEHATVVVQPEPRGMADAVEWAMPAVATENTLVVWGDQATLRAETIRACAALHEDNPVATLTLPTCARTDPYVCITRDELGRLVSVEQAREGEVRRAHGENDCGLFLFSSVVLKEVLQDARQHNRALGARTGEFNLLPLLPEFERAPGSVRTVRIEDLGETIGINSREDVALAEHVLRSRAEHYLATQVERAS